MSPKYLVAIIAGALAAALLSAQSVEQGIDAWQKGDFPHAVAIWKPLAEAGNADAQFNLGQAYRLGRGIATNATESRKWFERSAEQGHVDAQTMLGLLLFQTGERVDGLKWLKLAAEQDEPRAMLVYGTALYNGDGVTQDPVLGYAYVRRAAEQGLKPARDTLGQLDGLMSAQDKKQGTVIAKSLGKAAGAASFGGKKAPQTATKKVSRQKAPKPVRTQTATAEPAKDATPKAIAQPAPELKPKATPKPVPKPASVPPASATGAWRIQLGAFGQRGNAEALYKKVSGNRALAGRKPFYVAAGTVTRLQVGPFESKAAAAAACNVVGIACFPVPAK